VTASGQLHQDRVEELIRGDFVEKKKICSFENNVRKFHFYFIKISFPVHFLFKWRQNLSVRPRSILQTLSLHCKGNTKFFRLCSPTDRRLLTFVCTPSYVRMVNFGETKLSLVRRKIRRVFSKLWDHREVVNQSPFTAKALLQSQTSSCRTENMLEYSAAQRIRYGPTCQTVSCHIPEFFNISNIFRCSHKYLRDMGINTKDVVIKLQYCHTEFRCIGNSL